MANSKLDTITHITPTFLLKGIDPVKVITNYLNRKYDSLRLPLTKITTATNFTPVSLLPRYGDSVNDQTYIYRDKTNNQQIITTSNHYSYSIVRDNIENGRPIQLLVKGKCRWCHLELKVEPVGIPIKIEILGNRSYVFHVDGQYCSFECCYAGLKRLNIPNPYYRDPLYMDSEQMLKLMYSVIYPNAGRLREAPDWTLLKENDGPLDAKEFFNNSHIYQRTTNIILLPVKIEYTLSKSL